MKPKLLVWTQAAYGANTAFNHPQTSAADASIAMTTTEGYWSGKQTAREKRHALIVSDHTGLTARAIAHSLLSQFPQVEFRIQSWTFVDRPERVEAIIDRWRELAAEFGEPPLVFATMVDEEIRRRFTDAGIQVHDLFAAFVKPLEEQLCLPSQQNVGRSHGVNDEKAYSARIDAVHFAMQTDDGLEVDHYENADLIIVGVSRCGKTPTSLYLSLHYGIYVSNYPLTDQELDSRDLPPVLEQHRHKLFGLTIDPYRLLQIRQQRYSGASYSDPVTCQREIAQAESLFRTHRLPTLNTTRMSVEEIGAMIINRTRDCNGDGNGTG